MNRYEVGMMFDKVIIEAPSAAAAAVYYGLYCVSTNNPFMAVIYTENGEPFEGDSFWLSFTPDVEHVEMVMSRITKEEFKLCRVVEDETV